MHGVSNSDKEFRRETFDKFTSIESRINIIEKELGIHEEKFNTVNERFSAFNQRLTAVEERLSVMAKQITELFARFLVPIISGAIAVGTIVIEAIIKK